MDGSASDYLKKSSSLAVHPNLGYTANTSIYQQQI